MPGVSEVNTTHSDDPKREWNIKPPQIVVGKTDHFKSYEESNHQFRDEKDDKSSLQYKKFSKSSSEVYQF